MYRNGFASAACEVGANAETATSAPAAAISATAVRRGMDPPSSATPPPGVVSEVLNERWESWLLRSTQEPGRTGAGTVPHDSDPSRSRAVAGAVRRRFRRHRLGLRARRTR